MFRYTIVLFLYLLATSAQAQDISDFEKAYKKLNQSERIEIQAELKQFGEQTGGNIRGYQSTIDGVWGRNTATAIIEAYTETFQYLPKDMWDSETQFLAYILEPYEFWGEGGECDGCGESAEVFEGGESKEVVSQTKIQDLQPEVELKNVIQNEQDLSKLPVNKTINTTIGSLKVKQGERVLLSGIAENATVELGGVLEINGMAQKATNNGGTLVINGMVNQLVANSGKTRVRGIVQKQTGAGEILEGENCSLCEFKISVPKESTAQAASKSAAQQLLSQPNATLTMECNVISTEGLLQVGLSIFDNDTVEYRQDGLAVPMSRGAGNGTFDSEGNRYVIDISDPRGLPILVLFNTKNKSVQFNVMSGLVVHNGRCN